MNDETGPRSNRILLDDPLTDGRQSETALKVWRGAARLLRIMDYACLPEVTLASGRRADLLALGPKQELWIIEVKSSIADFRADTKWPDYRRHCDRLFFATHPDVPLDIFPDEAGLILSDGFGARNHPRSAGAQGCRRDPKGGHPALCPTRRPAASRPERSGRQAVLPGALEPITFGLKRKRPPLAQREMVILDRGSVTNVPIQP